MKPRPFEEKLDSYHREGSMVLDSARNIGVLKDLTKYGATFMPLDLNMEQKEKASWRLLRQRHLQEQQQEETPQHLHLQSGGSGQ